MYNVSVVREREHFVDESKSQIPATSLAAASDRGPRARVAVTLRPLVWI